MSLFRPLVSRVMLRPATIAQGRLHRSIHKAKLLQLPRFRDYARNDNNRNSSRAHSQKPKQNTIKKKSCSGSFDGKIRLKQHQKIMLFL